MSFHTPTFLFVFLPISLILFFLADKRYRKYIVLAASLVFFAWDQLVYLPLMVFIILFNFYAGRTIEQQLQASKTPRGLFFTSITINLILLVFFKMMVTFGNSRVLGLLETVVSPDWIDQAARNPLPLGLSYISFQVIAYLIDVYNQVVQSEKKPLNFALYILLFPKIITGPITRYQNLVDQLENPQVSILEAANGIRRFILGLAKKILIADTIARIVNPAFNLDSPNFPTGIAWLVLVGYAVQLYFDFSGYTDMAIGLGQALGFKFIENFNYPYISKSIGEFWRRWHISLSSWFRDYVFYPLEFSRRRSKYFRQQLNILFVFLLTGLWHGIDFNFAVWGLIHGLAIAVETTGFGRWLKRTWAPFQHFYALFVILIGWVFFRSADLPYALRFMARLFGWQGGIQPLPYSQLAPLPIVDHSVWLALALGILFSMPVHPIVREILRRVRERFPSFSMPVAVGFDLILLFLLFASVAAMVGAARVGSIYGKF